MRDSHEAVRIAALQFGLWRHDHPAEVVAAGLQDAAPAVRSAAAAAASKQPGRGSFAVLVVAIEREADPDAFRNLHRALVAVSGCDLALPFDGERTALIRDKIAREWRAELERGSKGSSGA
jgi:hypothetical protein